MQVINAVHTRVACSPSGFPGCESKAQLKPADMKKREGMNYQASVSLSLEHNQFPRMSPNVDSLEVRN